MRTDRELLELAAKAAGLEYHWVKVDGGSLMQASEPGSRSEESWNPLTDDGDALRLAVKLRLCLKYHNNAPPELDLPRECAVASNGAGKWFSVVPQKADENAAMRRAIVIAAAEIGAQWHPKQHNDGGADAR